MSISGSLPVACALSVCVTLAQADELREVRSVLDRFESIRPTERDLAVYQLDWAPTLQQAKARAAQNQRPILLIVVTNSFGNMYTGHC